MNALPDHAPLLPSPPAGTPSPDALAACVAALDPGSRALLDLSLRRRVPFEAMAGVLRTDPFDLARRRARAVARIAAELDLDGAGVVAAVKAALARLPDEAWGVPVARPAAPVQERESVQAEPMAAAARALMVKLEEHRERARASAQPAPASSDQVDAPDAPVPASEQPTVETEAIRPEVWRPVAATPTAAAFSHHPAFAVEVDDASALPPLAEALARAAASERSAVAVAVPDTAVLDDQPTLETPAIRIPIPLDAGHQPRGRLARGGVLVGLLLAVVRFLLRR